MGKDFISKYYFWFIFSPALCPYAVSMRKRVTPSGLAIMLIFAFARYSPGLSVISSCLLPLSSGSNSSLQTNRKLSRPHLIELTLTVSRLLLETKCHCDVIGRRISLKFNGSCRVGAVRGLVWTIKWSQNVDICPLHYYCSCWHFRVWVGLSK